MSVKEMKKSMDVSKKMMNLLTKLDNNYGREYSGLEDSINDIIVSFKKSFELVNKAEDLDMSKEQQIEKIEELKEELRRKKMVYRNLVNLKSFQNLDD